MIIIFKYNGDYNFIKSISNFSGKRRNEDNKITVESLQFAGWAEQKYLRTMKTNVIFLFYFQCYKLLYWIFSLSSLTKS